MHLFEISKSTMMIVLVAGHFFSGILVIAYTSKREKTRAFHVYLLSKFLQLCSWSLLDIKDQISGMGIIAFGNSLLFAGVTCELIAFLSLKDGMLPKAKAIEEAIRGGVRRVHVISYKSPDSILAEVFTNEGTGTLVVENISALSPAEQQAGG